MQRWQGLAVAQQAAGQRGAEQADLHIGRPAVSILQQAADGWLGHRLVTGQQAAQRAAVEQTGLGLAGLERGHAQPQRMAGAGERHVEQAQILLQALLVGGGPGLGAGAEVDHTPTIGPGPQHKALAAVHLGAAKTAGKGQADQRVLQALALVHGDHLDQVGIAFQAQHLLVGAAALGRELAGQPADQRLLAVQLAAGGLQQLGQVQHIGQSALAVGLLQPARRQAQAMQGLAQHGQHALALPDPVEMPQQLDLLLKGPVVLAQPRQLGQRQAQGGGGQRGAQLAAVQRVGHRLQPAQQVSRLGAGQHRILVRQINRRHPALTQRAPHRIGLAAGAHQHRDVGRAQPAPAAGRIIKAGSGIVEQPDDVLGAGLGQAAQ